jgi:pilus assembly protein CpaB
LTVTNRRTSVLIVALLIGALAAFFAYGYVNSVQDKAYKGARLVRVFTVKKDVEKNLGGDQALDQGLIQADSIPEKFRPGSALTDKNVIRGKVALTKLTAGQVLVDGMFVDPRIAQVTAAKRIPAGQVAVTISVDQVHGVAGLVVPGDKVNIMGVGPDGAQHTLYQNVDVLFIGNTAAPEAGSTASVTNPGSSLMTLAVPQDAAQKLVFLASQQSDKQLYFTLVPPDNQPTSVSPANNGNVFSGGPTPYAH